MEKNISDIKYTLLRKSLSAFIILSLLVSVVSSTALAAIAPDENLPPTNKLPPTVSTCDNSTGNIQGPSQPPTPFLYLPYDAASFNVNTWNSQMDHTSPNYQKDGVVSTLGEKLSYKEYHPAYQGDTNPELKGGTWAWPGPIFWDHTVDPTTKAGYYPYYQSRWLAIGEELYDSRNSYLGYDGHDGQDFGVSGHALAAAAGVVVFAGDHGDLLGRVVEIYHPAGYITRYAHLASITVSKGQVIDTPGFIIGTIGGSAHPKNGNLVDGYWGIHLHFSVYRWNSDKLTWEVTDPFGWDPLQAIYAQVKDPLVSCNGEVSYDLWFGFWPQPYNNSNSSFSANTQIQDASSEFVRPSNDQYLGGDLSNSIVSGTTDQASFIADVSIPDGTIVSPGQSLTKTWRMQNTGTSTWGSGYQLAFISGEQMGAQASVDVPTTAPNQQVDLSVNITAPSTEGQHEGHWKMRNSQGTYFGDEIWIKINVKNGTPPSEDAIHLTCSNCPSEVLPGQTFRPTIHAVVNTGKLLESDGDMLLNTDGNLYGAYDHVGVVGQVNAGQGYDFTFYADHPIQAPNTPGTYETKWRVWRDNHFDGNEITIQFKVGGINNHPPNAPTPTGPNNWAAFSGPSGITLSAHDNGDPDGDSISQYYFEIFDSAQIPNSGWITENHWSPPNLGLYTFKWHVKVMDSRGAESDWSEAWNFSVNNPNPVINDFHWRWLPASLGGGDTDRIELCANTDSGGVEVWVNLANDGSEGEWKYLYGGPPVLPCSDNPFDAHAVWFQLDYASGTHLVRLYATKNDTRTHQDISITLDPNQRPGRTDQQYPDHEYVNSQTIHFLWSETYRTTSYHLQVSTDTNFNSSVLDITLPVGTHDYTYTFPTDYETLYWRVTSIGPYGSNFAQTDFHIDVTPPSSAIAALAPVTPDTSVSVNWSGSDDRSGLRWYHVQIRDGNRPDSEWTDWLVNTTKTGEILQGQAGHTYYFRVRAMDNMGNWEEWPSGDGDTFTKLDPSAVPSEAWWNQSYAWKRNLSVLNNVSYPVPVHFPLHIHFDSTTTPTASEIYNASASAIKGDDVRIVYNNQTELNRSIQYFSSDRIDIWFPSQASLGGGQGINTAYQIYYDNPAASNPPSDINAIFMPEADANTVGLWHFQEGIGSTVYDSSGRGHNGNFLNSGWGDGLFGTAGYFNGSNSCVDFGTTSDFTSTAFTVEAWIYMTNNQYEPMIMMKGVNGENNVFRIKALQNGAIGQLDFHLWSGDIENSISTPEGSLKPNQWYHIAAVSDGSNMSLYINGVKLWNRNAGTVNQWDRPVYLGCAPWWPLVWFPGYIQHVRISNIARTDFPYALITTEPSVAAGSPFSPPVPGSADLAVQSVSTYTNPDGTILVQAVVTNQGTKSTTDGFYTDLYLNHVPIGSKDYTGTIHFWVNDPISAGATVTLTTILTSLSTNGLQALAPSTETTGTIYVQADSTGALTESNKANNISSGVEVCMVTADAYEDDGTPALAKSITPGQSQVHNATGPGDQDWVKFTAQAGEKFTIFTSNLGPSADTYLYVFSSDGTTLLGSNDDYGRTLASRIDFTAPSTGTFYILVKQWNPNTGGCGTNYTLTLDYGIRIMLPLVKNH